MSAPPVQPKIYHIAHMDRLPFIIHDGFLWSDSVMVQRNALGTTIGMTSIKQRRLRLPVDCNRGTHVGDYVPFYFCPRSIMLYVIHCANHSELAYRGGQGPIVHFEADLNEVVRWSSDECRAWAFSLSNAGASYTEFRNELVQLEEIDWPAVASHDFRSADVKEGKQAEFLVYGSFPWSLIRRIGVHSRAVAQTVAETIRGADHRPPIEIRPDWYY